MKILNIVGVSVLLTGCAGMNSEFDHAIPAKDSGYWMQQADDMTTDGHLGSKNQAVVSPTAFINIKDYKLIDTGNLRLPVKTVNSYVANVSAMPSSNVPHLSFDGVNIESGMNQPICSLKYCYPEPNNPWRETDRIARVWLAPYVSPDNNVHLGEIVYYVTKKSQWAGVEEGK